MRGLASVVNFSAPYRWSSGRTINEHGKNVVRPVNEALTVPSRSTLWLHPGRPQDQAIGVHNHRMIRAAWRPPRGRLKSDRRHQRGTLPMKIGFIGLGRMGHHVAANLLKAGHQVTVWNRSQAPVQALVEKGATAAKYAGRGGAGRCGLLHALQRPGDARCRPGRAAAGKGRQGPDPCESGDHLGGLRQGTGRSAQKGRPFLHLRAGVRPARDGGSGAAGAGGRRR